MKIYALLFVPLLLALSLTVRAESPPDPNVLVEQTVQKIARALDGRQRELERDLDELYRLIDEILLPRFDTETAARLVLGRFNWREASPEQRERFISAFYNFVLRTYARGLLNFDQNSLTILPPQPQRRPDQAEVRTEVRLADGTRVPVNYRLRLSDNEWRVFDVVIEGISYVQNYQNQFQAEISQRGLDAVIARLEAEAERLTRQEEVSEG
ncbi:MAG: ABC transporter substrate-binding protein [Chromatiales bacterium]|nr:ABC transporter substrate-binding protein [Chromatiales bacterium]